MKNKSIIDGWVVFKAPNGNEYAVRTENKPNLSIYKTIKGNLVFGRHVSGYKGDNSCQSLWEAIKEIEEE